MRVLAIDPGTFESAFVVWDGERIIQFGKCSNEILLASILNPAWHECERCAIEMVASFGMPVGREVFETVFWIGRFAQAFGNDKAQRITRAEIKTHICRSQKANDGNIRQAIIDRFGGKAAIGVKAAQGPLYGISGDVWSALAVALTFWDQCPSAV